MKIGTLLSMTWGFLVSLLERYLPFQLTGSTIENTLNYMKISDPLASSGQPNKEQFASIKEAGYKAIINLLPPNTENALKGEEALVKGLGMQYIGIPVAPWRPTEDDFSKFVATLNDLSGEKVWVHCAVNARASAFIFRYRVSVLGEDKEMARWDVREIWEPFGAWARFMDWK